MPELNSTFLASLANRYELANSQDWQALLNHFELGEGFAFILLLVPNDDGAEVCRDALTRYLREREKRVLQIPTPEPGDLKNLADTLLATHPDEGHGAIWVGRAIPEGVPEFRMWSEAWREGAARLNQFRNPLRRQFDIPLIFAGAPWLQQALRESAPDLWSVRTLVAWVEPQSRERVGPSRRFAPQEPASQHGPDIELALSEASRLRLVPGKDLAVARLLYRAGLGFVAQYRWREAADAFSESLDLRRKHGASASDLADSALQLGRALTQTLDYDQAIEALSLAKSLYKESANALGEARCIDSLSDIALALSDLNTARARYEEALPLYRGVGYVLGEANCILNLGNIALARSDYRAAQARYEDSLRLYRQVGDVLGEANAIERLGDIAFQLSDHNTAWARYEEALRLHRDVGDLLGEANCIRSIGDIALRRFVLDTARARYEEALSLYQRAGTFQGQANCLHSLGNIALARSDHDTARTRYEEALLLYERIGDVLGEANCIRFLGKIQADKQLTTDAKKSYETALKLYMQIPEPYSIGETYKQLAAICTDMDQRAAYLEAARKAFESIGRDDLVEALKPR
jgi:tetratricopeptide (TPR) repeat protein